MPTTGPADIFHILGDVSHTASKLILIHSIHSNQSAEGVSLLTQLLYILVFLTRYLDVFWVAPWRAVFWISPWWSWWNFTLKIFYIGSSAYIVWVMMRKFARTREKERGWRLALGVLAGSIVAGPVVCRVVRGWEYTTKIEVGSTPASDSVTPMVLWTFSIILESLCILPQLLLLRQTTVPTVLDSFYLVTLGSYRFFYLIKWIVQSFTEDQYVDPIAVTFGIVQTALYLDFAWVYWTRQRVKLRGGGIVDGDDLSKSFLVRRFIGQERGSAEEEGLADEDASPARQENGTAAAPTARGGRSWGARGISVSADDTLAEHDRIATAARSPAGGMADPAAFEDEDDDADAPLPHSNAIPIDTDAKARGNANNLAPEPVGEEGYSSDVLVGSSAEEWQENDGRQ
ncbi:hypothetical protein LTR91_016304 [Friedmanniomyces endolithicus]|uniref:ER lumen protein-retaining receptor n=1 Tax=Friedmanniomyces endolithicus TaxID=329885 RepID=A0AAN6K8C0_9PEZI|nr:hypothetical protein LTR94_008592 [Friedmanniomyces endolithicus]KAK0777793.1 hypothetical protein LTR59_013709 [Friedmanniomyces endolithicus]KAK0796456.1 hypothetical protein LTR38_008504 [Friedmanniomyces endolithicus]KAK0798083.1 hypothetical protein LTR75_009670 [Friedmanniomyces endolithicus]KAK0836721.1 hypothetical protein LTR03_013406 [Friedmanniomyces endolithicus]